MQQRKDIKMNWFNEIQGNKAAEVFNDATKVAADYSLRLWEKQVETARSFADRNTSRALGAQDFNSAEDALQLQRSAGEAELAEWRRTVEEFSQLANDAGEEFAAVADKSFNVWDKSLQDASKKSPFLFPNGVQTDAYVNSVGIFLKMAKDSGEVFKNNMLDFGRAAQQGTQAIVKNGHAAKAKGGGKAAKRS